LEKNPGVCPKSGCSCFFKKTERKGDKNNEFFEDRI
jgi:hypothetical protein